MAEDGTLAGLTFEQVKDLSEEGGQSHKLKYLFGQSAIQLTAALTRTQYVTVHETAKDGGEEPPPVCGFDRPLLLPEVAAWAEPPPMEAFHRNKLIEQQRALIQSEMGGGGGGGGFGGGGGGGYGSEIMREQLEQQKLIHRMTLQKLHVLEADSCA